MKKTLLMTPGPSQVPPATMLSMAEPIFHHRTPEYQRIQREVCARLKRIFFSSGDALLFTSSGTGAMEASVVNVLGGRRKALVVEGGKFGERWREICTAFGCPCESVKVEWGDAVSAAEISKRLAADRSIAAVYVTLCETSTGAETDVRAVGEAVAKTDAVLVVDGISGAGGCELRLDDWGVDILVVGSQKALMMPPGLAVAMVSAKARRMIETAEGRRTYYFDIPKAIEAAEDADTPYTPANTLVRALNVSLAMIEEEGIEKVFARHRVLAEATRAGVKALGLELFAKRPATVVTAVRTPKGVDGAALPKLMERKYGVQVAGGQAELKGKVIRIAHMGYCTGADIILTLSALEMALVELGWKCELGAGVRAAEAILSKAAI